MLADILKSAWACIPKSILDDKIADGLFCDLINVLENGQYKNIFPIRLNKNIYNFLAREFDPKDLDVLSSNETFISALAFSATNAIQFIIGKRDKEYRLKVKYTIDGKTTEIIYLKYANHSELYKTQMEELDSYIKDYKKELLIFNSKLEQVHPLMPNTSVLYEDAILNGLFANEFGIDASEAEYYRAHFKENAEYLNISRSIDYANLVDEFSNKFSFKSPFYLKDLNKFINDEFDKAGDQISESEPSNAAQGNFIKEEQTKELLELIKSCIGEEGKFVINEAFYENLINHYLGFSPSIMYTNGIIIRKYNNEYTLYVIELRDNKLTAIPKRLSEKDLEYVFNSCENNYQVENLREFFGIIPDINR